MGARSAQIKAADRCAIAGSSQERPHGEQLVERQLAMKDVAAAESIFALEVEWCDDLRRNHLLANARNRVFERCKYRGEERVTRARPIGGAEHTRRIVDVDRSHVRAGRRQSAIEQRRDRQLEPWPRRELAILRVIEGALQ